jgi:hypothetical protein
MSLSSTVKLGTLAEIIPGVSVRDYEPRDIAASFRHEDMAEANIVPVSALDEDLPLNQDKTQPVWVKSAILRREDLRSPVLREFDIILTNRNEPRVVLLSDFQETKSKHDGSHNVASGPLMIVRLKEQGGYFFWRAQYLAWWLGHAKTRRVLRRMMKGTTVKVLTRPDMENLDVPIPAPDRRLEGATTEKLIADHAENAKELRRKLHEQAELEYNRAQEVLYRMAIGKLPVIR